MSQLALLTMLLLRSVACLFVIALVQPILPSATPCPLEEVDLEFSESKNLTCPYTHPHCGDSVVDEGEACDDGNFDDSDGCTSECTELCPTTEPTYEPPTPNTDYPLTELPTDDGSGAVYVSEEVAKRRRRRRFINICPHKCSPLNALRAGSKTVTAVGLRPALRAVDPGSIAGMLQGLDYIRAMVCLLGKVGPKPAKEYVKLQVKLIDAIVGGLAKIEKLLLEKEGAAIWIRVTGDCCQVESCCVFWKRRNWVKVHNWIKCLPAAGPLGFPIDDLPRLAKAIGACVKAALPKFSCTNTKTKSVTLNL